MNNLRLSTQGGLRAWLCLLIACLAAAAAPAQEGPLSLELSFSNPGARSMGFGGAFVALADDATAAFANPAGLVQLTRREVSLEGRLWSYTTPFTEGGRLAGSPTGIGLDTVAGLREAEATEDLAGVSFVSFVYPKKRWAFALYRHQLAKFESFSETQGFFEGNFRLDDFRRSTELDIVAHAAAVAFRATERLSFGLTLTQFSADANLITQRFNVAVPGTLPDGPGGRNAYLPAALAEVDATISNDTALGLGLGALWRVSPSWSMGASYRQGPELGFRNRELTGSAFAPGVPAGIVTSRAGGDIQLPDVLALGCAYRSPGGRLTVGFEWDCVEYSSIIDSLGVDATDAALDDGDELHLGFEVVFPGSTPVIALRAGAWLDPDHRIRFVGTGSPLDDAIFRGGSDELHFALGLGVVFDRFKIDAAVDISDLVSTASVSGIYSF